MCSGCGRYGHVEEKCYRKNESESRSTVPKSLTQSAQVANVSEQERTLDPKAIMEELKQLREEMKRQNNQFGNSLFAETSRASTSSSATPNQIYQGERGISFVCDSGAASHMVNDAGLFTSFVGCDV